MNNQIKKFLLLPSLLLANAYLLTGVVPVQSIVEQNTTIKEKTTTTSNVKKENIQQITEQKNSLNYYLFLSFLTISIISLAVTRKFLPTNSTFKIIKNLYFTKIKLQNYLFDCIKSFKKIVHSTYYSLFFYSF